jgi:hypothetical protein
MDRIFASPAPRRSVAMRAILSAMVLSAALSSQPAHAEEKMTPEQITAIGVQAYTYFYPLITMDVTRRQLTNVNKVGQAPLHGPMNAMVNVPEYPPGDFKGVVRPNFDTLYSSAWLDLSKEPLVMTVPDAGGRFYLLPILDMWSNVFASPGWRTTGTGAQTLLIAGPGWKPEMRGDKLASVLKLPKGTLRLDSPTPYAWMIGRTKTDGPADYPAVNKFQAGLVVTPLSQWGKAAKPTAGKVDPAVDMKTPPKEQVDTMAAGPYFAYAAELLKLHPPHDTDQPILSQLRKLGFEAGKSFDLAKADPAVRDALARVPAEAQKLMAWKTPSLARVANGWGMNTDTMGVYGNYYLKRAIVAQVGLGANLPEDAIYPLNLGDAEGKPLDGANKYVLHFDKANLPPVDAFWSVTLYDMDGFQVPNALNRFAVSSWMKFKYNADGSLDLYFQNESPGKDKEANWLPTPKGPFNLTMRLYAPKSDALTGKWNPPAVTKAAAK